METPRKIDEIKNRTYTLAEDVPKSTGSRVEFKLEEDYFPGIMSILRFDDGSVPRGYVVSDDGKVGWEPYHITDSFGPYGK